MYKMNGPDIITVLLYMNIYIGANLGSYLRFIASLRLMFQCRVDVDQNVTKVS